MGAADLIEVLPSIKIHLTGDRKTQNFSTHLAEIAHIAGGLRMDMIEQALAGWKRSLLPRFEVGGLHSRNPTAHKWKAPFRSLMLREAVFWRLHDLLTQSYALYQQGHGLGARILLRSGVETLGILIYLNKLTETVWTGH